MKAYNAGADVTDWAAVYNNSEATVEQMQAAVTALNTATYNAHLAKASDDDPRDITEWVLTNPDFSIGDISGWETNYVSGQQANNIGYQANNIYTNGDAYLNKFIEAWRSNNNPILDGYLRQTVSDMPEGKYMLECDAIAVNQGNASATTTGALLFITADGSDYTASLSTGNGTPQHFSTQFLFTGDGDIIFGLKTVSATCNWIAADNFKVTFYGIDLSAYETQLATEVNTFNGVKESLDSDVKTALQALVDALNTTYTSSKTYAAAIANMQTINAYAAAVAAAKAADADATYDNVTGSEQTALTTAIADTPTYSDYTTYAAKTTALTTATSAFTAAANNYDALVREIAKAKALGIPDATANGYAATSETTAATALTNTQNLMVDEYNYVATNFGSAVNLGTWNQSDNAGSMTSQHWDGTNTSSYLEQGGGDLAYNLNSWTVTYDQNLSLPAGNYIFKVAGRTAADHVTINLNVTDVTDSANPVLLGTVNDFPKGDTGLGINKNGATSFDADDEAGFANNGNGRGWQWRYVKFTLANPATVKVEVRAVADAQYRWMSFCNATVQTDDADNVAIMEALVALNNAKTAATLTQHTNVGTGVFQLEATNDASLWNAYTTAKTNAENFTLTSSSTTSDVTALTTALTSAQTNYNNNQVINPADASTRYNLIVATSGHAKNGNAVIIIPGTDSENNPTGYALNANFAPNAALTQAMTFTQVSGNTYNISFNTSEGTTYLTYGTNNGSAAGWSDSQIQATTDATKKGEFLIAPTTTANVFNIKNTLTNSTIACQAGGNIYTEGGNADFSLAEASEASVTVAAKAGKYGTVIFPFTPDVSTGFDDITFYSCAEVSGDKVQMEEVATPAANVPYLIKNNNGISDFSKELTGWGTAAADSYSTGLLTGVYTDATIEASVDATDTEAGAYRYVLQTQNDTQAFYKVSSDFTATAYKAFLTVEQAATGSGDVKAFYLDFGGEDGINAIATEETQNATIYNIAGQRVQKAQKGIYIVNGKKVAVK